MRKYSFVILLIFAISCFAQSEHKLEEVTVVASRTTRNAEGYITNLRNTNITKGKPIADVLVFLPNISIENECLKINGLDVSDIYIDGMKLSDVSELYNIPGEMVDKVQVKYIAGSDQNANQSGGSIWITLRSPAESGYYGNLSLNAGWYRSCDFGNERVSGLIKYRYKNLSIYDNLSIGANKFEEISEQGITGPNMQSFLEDTSKSHGFNLRNRLSITQQFKSGAQLGGSYFLTTNQSKPSSTATTDNTSSSIAKRINTLIQEVTLKFSQPLNSHGASMELTGDYYNRHSNDNSNYLDNNELIGSQTDKNNLNLWKVKADFIYPRSRKLVWKFGASAQWIASGFTPIKTLETSRFKLSDIPTKTTGFIPIIYADAQGMIWKLQYSVGINSQINRIGYTDKSQHITDNNTQWSINPIVQIIMPFGIKQNHFVLLNYKRTLFDIPYTAISSVINWTDAYNYIVGNPKLKAQTADMVMTGLSLFRNKLNFTAYYAYAHDHIYWQTFQDDLNKDIFYTKPINISGQGSWGIGAEWIDAPVNWWRFKLSGRVEITPENITIEGVFYNKTQFKEYFYFNNNFTFSNGWGGMLNANLEPTFRTLDRTYHTVYNISGQIYKSLLNNRLQIAINFTPFGNRRKLDRQVGEYNISYKYISPVQYIGITIAWNFQGGKKVNVDIVDGIQNYQETTDSR